MKKSEQVVLWFISIVISLLVFGHETEALPPVFKQFNGGTPVYNQMVDCNVPGRCSSIGPVSAYGYAPSIIQEGRSYHAFFCSQGAIGAWDYIRYVRSNDGLTWTGKDGSATPTVMVTAMANETSPGVGVDYAACDPSVVYFQGPRDAVGSYYLYYTSAVQTASGFFQSVIQVARSLSIDGPYLTYTERGTWEKSPKDPKAIVKPLVRRTTGPAGYGAGQQTVAAKDGNILMWYIDDSASGAIRFYLLTSTDGVTFTPGVANELPSMEKYGFNTRNIPFYQNSFDIKYDPAREEFMIFTLTLQGLPQPYLAVGFSKDGIHWSTPTVVVTSGNFPQYAHNPGVSGDHNGWIVPFQPVLVGFAVPHGLGHIDAWGQWSLYNFFLDPTSITGLFEVKGIPNPKAHTLTGTWDLHTLTGPSLFRVDQATSVKFLTTGPDVVFRFADWDGDGVQDLVSLWLKGNMSKKVDIHIRSGADYKTWIFDGVTSFPETPASAQEFQLVDWDGDGVPDLASIDKAKTPSGTTRVQILSGVSHFVSSILDITTAPGLPGDHYEFRFIDWDLDGIPDLAAIVKTDTGTHTAEIHVLSGAKNFQEWILHTGTAFGIYPLGQVQFDLRDWDGDGIPDLMGIVKYSTGTGKTEVHAVSGRDLGHGVFQDFILHQPSILGPTDNDFDLVLSSPPVK